MFEFTPYILLISNDYENISLGILLTEGGHMFYSGLNSEASRYFPLNINVNDNTIQWFGNSRTYSLNDNHRTYSYCVLGISH